MKDEEEEFESAMSDVRRTLSVQKRPGFSSLGSQETIAIAETVRFLSRIKKRDFVSENDERFIETWIDQSQNILRRDYGVNTALSLRYYRNNRKSNRFSAQMSALEALLSLGAIEAEGPNLGRTSTEWDITVRCMAHLKGDVPKILDSSKEDEPTGDVWFVVLNAIEVLNGIQRDNMHEEYRAFKSAVEEYRDNLFAEMRNSPGLEVYAHDLSERGILPVSVSEPPANPHGSAGIFSALGRLYRGEKVETSDIPWDGDKEHLYGIAKAWARGCAGEPTGIIPYYEDLDVDEIFRRIWGNQSEIQDISVDGNLENALG